MLFSKNPPLPIIACPACRGDGSVGFLPCGECRGMARGVFSRGRFLYYGEPLSLYAIHRRRMQDFLHRFELLGAIVFVIGFLGVFLWRLFIARAIDLALTSHFWLSGKYPVAHYFWFACLGICFLVYRSMASERGRASIPRENEREEAHSAHSGQETWRQIRHLPRRRRFDISRTLTLEARGGIEQAVLAAKKYHGEMVEPVHIFFSLLRITDIRGVFVRLGVSPRVLEARIAELFPRSALARVAHLSADTEQILFHAYEEAARASQMSVGAADLLVATVRQSPAIQEVLYDMAIDAEKLANVVAWIRIREHLKQEHRRFARVAAHRSKYGIDRAMTAVATPFLNAYSQDITLAAKYGYLMPCVARDKEIEEIFRSIESGRESVLLVGESGTGKMSIIEGIAQRMVGDAVPRRLHDKRLVQLSTSALLAGTTTAGAQERLIHMMNEMRRAGNVTLFINNVHNLMSINTDAGEEGLDVAETLAEYGGRGGIVIFATATPEGFRQHIVNSELGSLFARVDVAPMDANQAIQVLESRVGITEYKEKVFFSYDALASAVDLAKRYLHDRPLPESAVELMADAGSVVRAKKGADQFVGPDDVATVIEQKTGIPKTSISADESDKLLRLESAMHERVVGQDEAVGLVANALRRARAEIRSRARPIAAFLFVGPTGVGKTELAKTIAEVYFGAEDRMIRLDMSEFQDTASVYRLIGQPGRQGTGLLTEPVRQHPFSLVLLDELEKADPDVLNLFLQVFDDGRLTDSVGRVIDFTNTIIIATSNAGTAFIQDEIQRGTGIDQIRDALVRGELKKYYRPEFLNRFDGIVLFKPLEREQIKTIAGLMLKRVAHDLENRGVELRVEDAALSELATIGFDPEYGARPLRRAIQDRVENQLADLVLAGKLKRRDVVVLGDGATVRVERN